MKAIVCKKHGPPEVLRLQEIKKPKPADGEVLIRVHAATVTRGDVILRKLHPLLLLPMRLFGVKKKRIPGHEFAGVIEEIGKDVTIFKSGDKVFGTTTGLSVGANAEYVCLPEKWKRGVLAIMPTNATYEEAAAIPVGGMTALEILKKGKIKSGDKVLIYGASGSVGTYAVQLARHYFDAEVTGVCSIKNIELVKSLGAEKIIDYTKEEITQSDQTYAVIFDAVGKISSSDVKSILDADGTFLSIQTTTKETEENLLTLKKLFEAGEIKVVIDSSYPLEQVADAHRRVESGHKVGNVVLSVVL